MTSVNIIGAGAYGNALAFTLAQRYPTLKVGCQDIKKDYTITAEGSRPSRLPGCLLPPSVKVTDDWDLTRDTNILLLAMPAGALRQVLSRLKPILSLDTYLVVCAKGIEPPLGLLMSEVIDDVLPDQPLGVLSGPSFASEMILGKPTGVSVASKDETTAQWLAQSLITETFRVYGTDDMVGVQLGGALKNVLAIACGILDAKDLGQNARAMLLTRGLAEIARLGVARGGRLETFQGLSGVGDLALTCMSPLSRNYSFGVQLGRGEKGADLLKNKTVEGVATAEAAIKMAEKFGVRMPLCAAVNRVVNGGEDLDAVISELLSTPPRLIVEDAEYKKRPNII